MMTSGYDTTQYLLDRANIHDTATKMYMYTDLKRWNDLIAEVFANEMTIDYSAMLGMPPFDITGEGCAQKFQGQVAHMDSTQHIITGLLIELPQPSEAASIPMTAKLIANASVTLVKKAAKGDPMTRNGGRGFFELVRTQEKGNPWRIRAFRAEPAWYSGNWDVFSA